MTLHLQTWRCGRAAQSLWDQCGLCCGASGAQFNKAAA